MRAIDKKKEIDGILGTVTENQFSDLSALGRAITDYTDQAGENTEVMDDELGVAVVFDEDEEEGEGNPFELKEESSDEEEEGEAEERTESMQTLESKDDDGGDDMEEEDPLAVDPKEIKAYWVKGQVAKRIDEDPVNSQRLSEEILKILGIEDERESENRLVQLLDYGKFDFIMILLRNRNKIVWCTKLAHAENDEEKQKIEEQMRNNPQLAPILDQLYRSGGRTKDLQKAMKKEAKNIKAKSGDKGEVRVGIYLILIIWLSTKEDI